MIKRKTKNFPTDAVMSALTGVLVSEKGIQSVYEVLSWMTGELVFTHQLGRISDEAIPVMVRMDPTIQLAINEAERVNRDNWREWLAVWKDRYGDEIAVPVMTIAEHERVDAKSELAEKIHPNRILQFDGKNVK